MSDATTFTLETRTGVSLPPDQLRRARIRLGLEKLFVGLVACLTAAAIGFLKFHNLHFMWYSPFYQVYSLIAGTFVLSRIVLSCFYREPGDEGHLPTITI